MMFEGRRYKQTAKDFLRGRRGIPALVSLVCYLILIFAVAKGGFDASSRGLTLSGLPVCSEGGIGFIGFLLEGIVGLAIAYFYLKFIESAVAKPTFDSFLEGLSLWWKGVLCQLWQFLWVSLWMCLFIIPGIVKMFAYSQMPFIIAENPKISVTKAMKLSKIMTQGHKGDLFLLCLSFIGWWILCSIPFVFLGVAPYFNTTMAITYKNLKIGAINEGKLVAEDFE